MFGMAPTIIPLPPLPHNMYQLSDRTIEAILKEWHPTEYNPLSTNIDEWIRSMELLCNEYGIPDPQRARCAVKFTTNELRVELESVLEGARARSNPISWDRFMKFMIEFDRESQLIIATIGPHVTEVLQAIFGKVGALLSIVLRFALMRVLLDSTSILPKAHRTHRGCPGCLGLHAADPGCRCW